MSSFEMKFHVVFVLDVLGEEFEIGGIFSLSSDAEKFRGDCLADPKYRGAVPRVQPMTMDQIKSQLVKDRLWKLGDVIERLVCKV